MDVVYDAVDVFASGFVWGIAFTMCLLAFGALCNMLLGGKR